MAATTDPKNEYMDQFGRDEERADDIFDLRRRLQLKTRFHHDSQDEAADIA